MEEGVQRVFLRHTVYHHEASGGAFGVCDQGVCPVQGSAEVLHFQDRAPLRQEHNGRCMGHVSNDFSTTRRGNTLVEATFELASCDPSPSRVLCQGVSHIPVAPILEDDTQHLSSLPSASATQCFFGQFGLPRTVDDIFLVSLTCVLLPN
jgi:hypothetical protein